MQHPAGLGQPVCQMLQQRQPAGAEGPRIQVRHGRPILLPKWPHVWSPWACGEGCGAPGKAPAGEVPGVHEPLRLVHGMASRRGIQHGFQAQALKVVQGHPKQLPGQTLPAPLGQHEHHAHPGKAPLVRQHHRGSRQTRPTRLVLHLQPPALAELEHRPPVGLVLVPMGRCRQRHEPVEHRGRQTHESWRHRLRWLGTGLGAHGCWRRAEGGGRNLSTCRPGWRSAWACSGWRRPAPPSRPPSRSWWPAAPAAHRAAAAPPGCRSARRWGPPGR